MKNMFKYTFEKIKGLFSFNKKAFTNEEIKNMSAKEYEENREQILSDVM